MSRSQNRNNRERTDLEQMSTAELEELIRQDFQTPGNDSSNIDELYYAAQVLAARKPDSGGAADRAWENFQEKYLPFADVRSALYEDGNMPSSDAARGQRRFSLRRLGVRGGLAAAVLAALILSVSMAAAAGGAELWRLLVRWTDENMELAPGQIVYLEEDDIHIPEEPKDYTSLREALEDYGLTRPIVPNWLPDGFELVTLDMAGNLEDDLIFNACYQRDEDLLVIFVRILLDYSDGYRNQYSSFQKDEGTPIPYEAGGITHMLATNAGRTVAIWANGPAECAVSADIPMDELKQIIDSIYE